MKKEEIFVYRTEKYPGPIAIDCKPSKELREYHENSLIQINIGENSYIKKVGK